MEMKPLYESQCDTTPSLGHLGSGDNPPAPIAAPAAVKTESPFSPTWNKL